MSYGQSAQRIVSQWSVVSGQGESSGEGEQWEILQ